MAPLLWFASGYTFKLGHNGIFAVPEPFPANGSGFELEIARRAAEQHATSAVVVLTAVDLPALWSRAPRMPVAVRLLRSSPGDLPSHLVSMQLSSAVGLVPVKQGSPALLCSDLAEVASFVCPS